MNDLPENVTLADLVAAGKPSNKKKYLRMALGNLLRAGDLGTVSLCIGRTGVGDEPSCVLKLALDGSIIGRYDGKTHEPWADKSAYDKKNWSDAAMSGDALHQLWREVAFGG